MCILHYYCCPTCKKLSTIPVFEEQPPSIINCWKPSQRPTDKIQIFTNQFCKRPMCRRYNYFFFAPHPKKAYYDYNPLSKGCSPYSCGIGKCTANDCRIEKVYKLCNNCTIEIRVRFNLLIK